MKNRSFAIGAVLAAVGLFGSSAMAAEWGHGMFPTDTLDQWKVGATIGYQYQFKDDTKSESTTFIQLERSERNQLNSIRMDGQLGLGYGLQAGMRWDLKLDESNDQSLTNGILFAANGRSSKSTHTDGFYNPVFNLRWDLVKGLIGEKEPFAFVLEYAYKPADWGNSKIQTAWPQMQHASDRADAYGFESHTVKAIGSYDNGNHRLYTGYEGQFNGTIQGYKLFSLLGYPDGYKMGDVHSFLFGSEHRLDSDLSLASDLKISTIENRDGFGDGYVNFDYGLTLNYRAAKKLWVSPFFQMNYYGARTYVERDFVSATNDTFGLTTGVNFRFVF